MALTDKLTAIGNAIREKEGSTDLIALGDMPERILSLPSGGSTVTGSEMLYKYMMDGKGYNETWTFVVPSGITQIRADMFKERYWLTTVEYEDENAITKIDASAFYNDGRFNTDKLPSNITEIKDTAFYGCRVLSLNELPSGLTKINYGCFNNCANLQLTTLPEGVTTIGNYAFYQAFQTNPPSLFTLPANVNDIGYSAFSGVGIPKIRFLGVPGNGTSGTTIATDAFKSTYITDIYVPWIQTHIASTRAPWGATNATIHYETSPDEVIE